MSDFSPELDPDVYAHLRALAGRIHAERGGGGHTMQATGLLHEAWMKLERADSGYNDRGHFLAVAARAMRQIMVDKARSRMSQRRGQGAEHLTLSGVGQAAEELNILELDQALKALADVNERAARVVMLRTFGGLSIEEAAEATGTSLGTVKRSWRFGRAWLKDQMDA